MDIRRLLNSPPRTRLPSEIPETPQDLQESLVPASQASTQSWDSQNGPRPAWLNESPTPSFDSFNNDPQTPKRQYNLRTTRSDRIRIRTALDFNIPQDQICQKYGYTKRQIHWAKST
jgi:hypothetical protein